MKKHKMLKDFGLIRYYGKDTKFCQVSKTLDKQKEITTAFYFGDAGVFTEFVFDKKVASFVSYNVKDIYDEYGAKDKYPTAEDFAKGFCEKYPFYKYDPSKTYGTFVTCDLKQFNNEKSVSQGLFNLAIFFGEMNTFTGNHFEGINEGDIREYNRTYLTKTTKKCKLFSIGSLVVSLVSLILAIVIGTGNTETSGWASLFIVLLLAGLFSAGFFFLKFKYFDHLRIHAKR